MDRFKRLLDLIGLLRSQPGMRVGEISQRCGISERTAFRDLKLLQKAGLPLSFQKGYQLGEHSLFMPLDLTTEEFLALNWALDSSWFKENAEFSALREGLLSKIGKHIPSELDRESGALKKAAGIDVKSTGLREKEKLILDSLQKAIEQNVTIQLGYGSLSSGPSLRRVNPYTLVFRRHAWYLAGYDCRRKGVSVFRLSRIKSISLTSERFKKDADFSLEKYFAQSWEVFVGKPVTVKVKFTGKVAKTVLTGKRHPTQKTLVQKDGSVLFTTRVAGLKEISHWILSYGSEAEVLEPKELRRQFKALAGRLSKLYSRK